MKKSDANEAQPASDLITKRITDLGGWRGETLARMRKLIKAACPDVVEEWKWMGTPVWSHNGILCTGESYKDKVKLTFAKGASSSPRAWGTCRVRMNALVVSSVHPHVRGEHIRRLRRSFRASGSSPRAWGTWWPLPARGGGLRFIPTCVGNMPAL